LENLTNALFGTFTKTIVNGRAVWSAICGTGYEYPGVPRGATEGLLCYVLRVLQYLGTVTTPLKPVITQAAHGFIIGDAIRYSGVTYVKAQSDTEPNSEVIGIVDNVPSASTFTLNTGGFMNGFAGLVPGQRYWLSDALAGAYTATEPVTIGSVSKPLFVAVAPDMAVVQILRGVTI
jgi:hypothetical protein